MIEYLVGHGSERAVDDIIEHTFQISVSVYDALKDNIIILFSYLCGQVYRRTVFIFCRSAFCW